jgi:hypothetical protein
MYHNFALNFSYNDIFIYNLGNDFFQMGEKVESVTEKIKNYRKSLDLYSEILERKEDKNTRDNYEIVQKRLEELEKPQPSQSSPQPSPSGEGVEQEEGKNQSEQREENNISQSGSRVRET